MRIFYFVFIIVFSFSNCIAQQTQISGRITNQKKEAVGFASIVIKGTTEGTVSQDDGRFSFTTKKEGALVLQVKYLGYKEWQKTIEATGIPVHVEVSLEPSAIEAPTVTISAGSFDGGELQSATSIGARDIFTTPGSGGDIFAALTSLPGTQPVEEEEGLSVRGGSRGETRMFIDEMVVQNPFYGSAPGIAQGSRFPAFMFQGSVLSTGGFSAQYGQALSSVLLMRTRGLTERDRYSVVVGQTGLNANMNKAFKNKKMSLGSELSYNNAGLYFKVVPQRPDYLKVPQGGGGAITFRYKPRPTGIFKIFTSYSANEVAYQRFGFDQQLQQPITRFEMNAGNYYLNASYKDNIYKRWQLFTATSYSRDERNTFTNLRTINSSDELTQGKMIFSTDYARYSSFKFGAELLSLNTKTTFSELRRSLSDVYWASFLETDVFVTTRLGARIGLRSEHSQILNQTRVSPRASLAYQLNDVSQVAVAYGDFYQSPENRFLRDNKNLGFEKSSHFIANYQYTRNRRAFKIESYYKLYDDLVKFPTPDDITALELTNTGDGYAGGVDMLFRDRKTFKNMDYSLSYSWLKTERNYREYPFLAVPSFAREHNSSLIIRKNLVKYKSNLGVGYSYASGRPYRIPGEEIEKKYNSGRTPDFNNVSANYGYINTSWVKNTMTMISLNVNNILGIDNIYTYRFHPDGTRESIKSPALRTYVVRIMMAFGPPGTGTGTGGGSR